MVKLHNYIKSWFNKKMFLVSVFFCAFSSRLCRWNYVPRQIIAIVNIIIQLHNDRDVSEQHSFLCKLWGIINYWNLLNNLSFQAKLINFSVIFYVNNLIINKSIYIDKNEKCFKNILNWRMLFTFFCFIN